MQEPEIKIVSIIPYKIFPAKLGGEKGIALFNEYLAQKVRLTGVTTRSNDPLYAKGYKLLNILTNSRLRYVNLLLFFRLRKILVSENATHLLIEHPYFGWLASMLRTAVGIKWVVHSHNIEYMRSKSIGRWWWRALKYYEGRVYRSANLVFFISDDDMQHAITQMGADPRKCLEVTYGIEQEALPGDAFDSRKMVMAKHGIKENETILLFNGALYHSTNFDALRIILDKINPYLLQQKDFKYKILVCGKGLPASFNSLKDYADKNIVYAGFVDDISHYFKAADIFLNPILSGGGVKTKAIEALAMNCTVVSTTLGAMGIREEVCGSKLHVVQEGEWEKFASLVVAASGRLENTPGEFFEYYYWGRVVDRAIERVKRR